MGAYRSVYLRSEKLCSSRLHEALPRVVCHVSKAIQDLAAMQYPTILQT